MNWKKIRNITLIGFAILLIMKGRTISTAAISLVWDKLTSIKIQQLHPAIRSQAAAFINQAEKQGIALRITSALRSYDEQAKLYAQGRTAPGPKVTNAAPGHSYHNFGLAFDVVEIKNGQPLWENPRWNEIGALGKSFGFTWGGEFISFKDRPHFQYDPLTLAQLRSRYQQQGNYISLT